MKSADVAAQLKAQARTLHEKFAVEHLMLFGSHARYEAGPESDVDLLVDFKSQPSFDRYMDLKFFLEDLLHRRVDLVIRSDMKPKLLPSVERDAIHVA